MFPSPMDYSEALHIGTVEFVSPKEIRVSLDIEAPESVAINTGTPRPFPRVHGYVLIPSDQGYLVGQIEWLTIEESAYPKRRGLKDFGLIDLPYPRRKISLNPLGDLIKLTDDQGDEAFQFKRGVESFPSVGDAVLLPTENQLHSIVESGQDRKVKIGTSPLAGDAEVFVDPDRLFGRHLAVLGNTGSGKSCSVAGLIRWCLNAASEQTSKDLNARFIILDPNGEYERAFGDTQGPLRPRIFKVGEDLERSKQLEVPLWFGNSAEWSAFTQASGKTQKPLLRRALRDVKVGRTGVFENEEDERKLHLRRYLTSKVIYLSRNIKNGTILTEETKFGFRLMAIKKDLRSKIVNFSNLNNEIASVIENLDQAIDKTYNSYEKDVKNIEYFRAFNEDLVLSIIESMTVLLELLGGIVIEEGPSEDIPLRYSGENLIDHLAILAEEEGVTQFVDFLIMRIRTLLSDTRMKSIISDEGDVTLGNWLEDYIGGNQEGQGCVSVIDLSLVPSEIIHIVTAVIARITFDALQRYRKYNDTHKVLPTVLVMEEAHIYVKRYRDDMDNQSTAAVCCKVFERIAREGRKFGLGLILSSQRPSELSPTVLSQCNSFLLHRISNDRDQDLVNRYVPDNLRGLLNDLPSLPSQNAILLGWASELPVLVRMNDLPKDQQPQSDDPDFWDVWTGAKERDVDWGKIADIWQQKER